MTSTATTSANPENLQDVIDQNSYEHTTWAGIVIDDVSWAVQLYDRWRVKENFSNIWEYLDKTLKTRAKVQSILDAAEDLALASTTPIAAHFNFRHLNDIITQANTTLPAPVAAPLPAAPAHIAHKLIETYLTPAEYASWVTEFGISSDKTKFTYKVGGAPRETDIIDMCEELYLWRKININSLNQTAAICLRAKRREEKRNENTNSASTNPTNPLTTIPWAPTWTMWAPEINEELSIPQLYAACEQAKKKPTSGSAYSFDKKWFFVRYNTTANQWVVQYQKKDGKTSTISEPSIGQVVAHISTLSEKKEAKSEKSLTVDMANELDENKIIEICEAINKNPAKIGYYKIGGKQFSVRYIPAAWGTNGGYVATYPNHTEVENTNEFRKSPKDLARFLAENIHLYNDHHDTDRFRLLELIKKTDGEKAWKRQEYIIKGNKHYIWSNRLKLWKRTYFAEVPVWEHGKEVVSAITQKGLYEKIQEKINHPESAKEKINEAKAEWAEPKDAAHTEDHGHSHAKAEGTFYDRSVEKIFGHGLIGRAFIGTKNLIPKPLRSLGGNTVGAGVTSGIVGWALYGGSLALGSVALSSAIVPAMTLTFAASMTNRFLKWRKWWPHNKKEDSGWHGWH